MARPKKIDMGEFRSVFCAVRLSPTDVDKLQRLSPLAGAPGDRSKTLRWLIEIAPEPDELAAQQAQVKQAETAKQVYERGYNQGYAKALDELSKWISRAKPD